jgi:hypothetical protein
MRSNLLLLEFDDQTRFLQSRTQFLKWVDSFEEEDLLFRVHQRSLPSSSGSALPITRKMIIPASDRCQEKEMAAMEAVV